MPDVGDSNTNLAGDKAAAAAAPGGQQAEAQDAKKNFTYPLVKYTEMPDEMRAETVDCIVTAVEKHSGNYEAAAKMVKETMDKKAGTSWHVVIGEGYAFDITHEMRNVMYLYFGGYLGVLVWKS